MKITVAGGDRRMKTVAELFIKNGFDCNTEEIKTKSRLLSEINASDAVLLPMPCSKNGFLNSPFANDDVLIEEVFSAGNEKTLFLGGMIPKSEKNAIDYAFSEEFLIKNAVLTAEGALEIAMREMKTALHGSNLLIVGFGRIGSYLAKILKELGASTVVVARSEKSKANAEISGHKVIGTDGLASALPFADAVFNTVPSILFNENELSALKKGAFIIDLASLPGGVDFNSAEKLGVKAIHALGLPGKYAPETAGKIIFEAAMTILRERGISV